MGLIIALIIVVLLLAWPHANECKDKGMRCYVERIWNGK